MEEFNQKPILLTADLQSGKTQYGSIERQRDTNRIWNYICQTAEKHDANIIIAGDFFDEPNLYSDRFHEALDIARETHKAGTRIGSIDGNHDMGSRSWFDFPESPIKYLHDKRLVINGCQIHCLNFLNRNELLEKLRILAQEAVETRPNVIIGHQMFNELAPMFNPKAPKQGLGQFGAADLKEMGWTDLTIFLGDIHTSCDWTDEENRIEVAYPGSPEVTASNEGNHKSHKTGNWEDTNTYVILWTPQKAWPQKWERVKLPNRPWVRKTISTYKPGWEERLENLLNEAEALKSSDPHGRRCIIDVKLLVADHRALKGTDWENFVKKAQKQSLVFNYQIINHEIEENQSGNTEITEVEEFETSSRFEREEASEDVLNRLTEKTQELAENALILRVAEAALQPDKNRLKEIVDEELQENDGTAQQPSESTPCA